MEGNTNNRFIFSPVKVSEESELIIKEIILKYGKVGTNSILETELNNALSSVNLKWNVRILQRNPHLLVLETSVFNKTQNTYIDHEIWISSQYQSTDNITLTLYRV